MSRAEQPTRLVKAFPDGMARHRWPACLGMVLAAALTVLVSPVQAQTSSATLGVVAFIPASCGVFAQPERDQAREPQGVVGVHVRCSAGTGAALHATAGRAAGSVADRMQRLARVPVAPGAFLAAGAQPAAVTLHTAVSGLPSDAEGVTATLVYSP